MQPPRVRKFSEFSIEPFHTFQCGLQVYRCIKINHARIHDGPFTILPTTLTTLAQVAFPSYSYLISKILFIYFFFFSSSSYLIVTCPFYFLGTSSCIPSALGQRQSHNPTTPHHLRRHLHWSIITSLLDFCTSL